MQEAGESQVAQCKSFICTAFSDKFQDYEKIPNNRYLRQK